MKTLPFKSSIQFLRRFPSESNGFFYHPDCPLLYAEHDTITTLADCPFPLVTDSFRVLLFGTSIDRPDDLEKGYGHTKRFAVVEYQKPCGHTVQERIPFMEGVKTFEHYGTVFTGESYSIADWKNRIERFRSNLRCEICEMVHRALWHYAMGNVSNSRARLLSSLQSQLNGNFGNWQDFVSWADVERRAKATQYNSRSGKVAE